MANAILAAILSFFIPGLGQAYAGDIKKGVIYFVIAVVLWLLYAYVLNSFIPVNVLAIIFDIYAAYDAYMMAKE